MSLDQPHSPPARAYPGHLRLLTTAQDCPCLTGHELLVLLALTLADPAQTGTCDPSLNTLARDARMARSTAKEAVRCLAAVGFVRVETQPNEAGKATSSNAMTLLIPAHDRATCPRCLVDADDTPGRNTTGGAIRPGAQYDRGRNTTGPQGGRGRDAAGVARVQAGSDPDLRISESGSDPEKIRIPPCPPTGGTAPEGTEAASAVVGVAAPPPSNSLPSSDAGTAKQVAVETPPRGETAAATAGTAPVAEKPKRVRAPRADRAAAKARETPMPEGWGPKPIHFTKGLELGLDEGSVRIEAELFASRTARDGKTYIDWDAAFRNHLGMEVKFALQRKAAAEAKAAVQSGSGSPADRIPEVDILQAYADGIIAAAGGTFVCEPRHLPSLRAMFKGHARDGQGEKIGAAGALAWFRSTATAYRRAVADEPPKFQGGYNPPACMNWLNSGRPLPRGPTAPHAAGRFSEETARGHGIKPPQTAIADDSWDP